MSVLGSVATVVGGALLGGLLSARSTNQLRRPSKRAGRAVLERMNRSHADVTAWGLSHVEIEKTYTILDVGCGGGRTLDRLATIATDGKVYGVDYSEESIAMSRETNAALIAQERIDVRLGTVSRLPFSDGMFDLVTAVETHYYWPDLPRDVREVKRVLKPGGTFIIVAETYRGRTNDWLYRPTMQFVLRAAYLSPEEHRALLVNAGFADVQMLEEKRNGWICVFGKAVADDARAATRRSEL